MPSLYSMAYPTYEEVSCQFLSSLEATFYYDTPHVRQGWGKIRFTVHNRVYNMNFKEIGQVLGFQDLEESSPPKYEELPKKI